MSGDACYFPLKVRRVSTRARLSFQGAFVETERGPETADVDHITRKVTEHNSEVRVVGPGSVLQSFDGAPVKRFGFRTPAGEPVDLREVVAGDGDVGMVGPEPAGPDLKSLPHQSFGFDVISAPDLDLSQIVQRCGNVGVFGPEFFPLNFQDVSKLFRGFSDAILPRTNERKRVVRQGYLRA